MPREPLRRSQRPVDLWTTAKALAHRAHRTNNKNRSGQLMCYQNRTTLCATDRENNMAHALSLKAEVDYERLHVRFRSTPAENTVTNFRPLYPQQQTLML